MLCVLALVVGGCGGNNGDASENQPPSPSDTATESAPTREEFIAAGDKICEQVNARTVSLNDRIDAIQQSATDQRQALSEMAPILEEAYDFQRGKAGEFRDLTPPAGDVEPVDKIVAAIEQQVALVGRFADAADAGDAERLGDAASEVSATRSRVRGLLQGYGFEECGRR